MFISDREIQLMLGDLTGFWNDYRMYYLMPTFYYSLQSAIIATIFLRNEQEVSDCCSCNSDLFILFGLIIDKY